MSGQKTKQTKNGSRCRQMLVRTAGGILGDGVLVDLVRGAASPTSPLLLIWDAQRVKVADRFVRDGSIYVPVSIEPTIVQAVRFPTGATQYGSTRELYNEISQFIAQVTHLNERAVAQIAFFVISTWFADCLPLAPLLWIVAPPTAPRAPLLQALGLLCRRSMSVAELTIAGLRALPAGLRPTVLVEVPFLSRPLIKVLHASHRRGTCVTSGGGASDISCAMVVLANRALPEPAVLEFPLEVVLAPTQEQRPPMDVAAAERVGADLHAKLQMYRLVNHSKVLIPHLDFRAFTAPTQELARNFAACIIDDEELRSQIVSLLEQRDREIQVDRAGLPESITLEALLPDCHEDGELTIVPTADVTRRVNSIRVGRGDLRQVSPESVGWTLRGLGLHTEYITNGRKGLRLLDGTRRLIHSLAAGFGVRSLRNGIVNTRCRYCVEFALTWVDEGMNSDKF